MHVLKDYPEVVKKIAFHTNHQLIHFYQTVLIGDKNYDIVHQILTEGLEKGMKTFGANIKYY